MARAPMSSDDDIEALDAVCRRMNAFDERVSLEWLDGYLCALAASRRRIEEDEWLAAFAEGVFARTFADPADAALARRPLSDRWRVLLKQLDPERILDDVEELRLAPLMVELSDEDKQSLVDEGHIKADELHLLEKTGEVWAVGFLDATLDFADDWPDADPDTEEGEIFEESMLHVAALTYDDEELGELFEEYYEGQTLNRDELIHEAMYAVQDLRLYWLENPQPAPPQRRVGDLPGRNDPCPCGSGKKFKKCHGAQMQ